MLQTFMDTLVTGVRNCGAIFDDVLIFFPRPFFLVFIPLDRDSAFITFSLLSSDRFATFSSCSSFGFSVCTVLRTAYGSLTFGTGESPNPPVDPDMTLDP